jgi:hypothetical protein
MTDIRPGTEDLSAADLIHRATEQLTTLIRDELALARAEMTEKAKRAGLGVGLFGGAGIISLYGVFGVLTATVLLLARVMPAWGAAGLVGLLLLAFAGVLALVGESQVSRATPPIPAEAVESVRADIDAVKTAVQERGRG